MVTQFQWFLIYFQDHHFWVILKLTRSHWNWVTTNLNLDYNIWGILVAHNFISNVCKGRKIGIPSSFGMLIPNLAKLDTQLGPLITQRQQRCWLGGISHILYITAMEITIIYFWNQHDRISLTQSKPCIHHIHSSQNSMWPTFCRMTHNSSQALMTFFIHFLSSTKALQVCDISSCCFFRNTRDFAVFPGSMLPKPTSATLVMNA